MRKEIFLFDKKYILILLESDITMLPKETFEFLVVVVLLFCCIGDVCSSCHTVSLSHQEIPDTVSSLRGQLGAWPGLSCFILAAIMGASFYEMKELEQLMKIRANEN